MALAERCGLAALTRQNVKIASRTGVNADLKAGCLVAGMAAGADSIDDMDVLRHGAMEDLFGGVRAPSTLGSFLRSFTWGNVRQLEKASRVFLARLAFCHAAAARRRRAGVRGHGLDAEAGLRAREGRRRVRAHQDRGQEPAGTGPERARGRGLHAAGRAAGRGDPAAGRQRGLRPGSGVADGGGDQRSPRSGLRRDDRGADGLGVLRREGDRRDLGCGGVLLGHGADGREGPGGDRRDRPGRLDADRLPARDLG